MNSLDKVQGWCDSPLTDAGRTSAMHLGKGLYDVHFDAAYCSTLRRTLQTAQLILKHKGQEYLHIAEEEGLKEVGFGGFESGRNLEMWQSASFFLGFRSYEKMVEALFSRKISYKQLIDAIHQIDSMQMAEDFTQVERRTHKALHHIAQKGIEDNAKNILVVSHAMSICCMLENFGGSTLLNGHLENASVCKVAYQNGTFHIKTMNDMNYVTRGKELSTK